MVGFANSRTELLIDPTSVFPTESDEIGWSANGRRFHWTLADGNAHASAPECLSNGGSTK